MNINSPLNTTTVSLLVQSHPNPVMLLSWKNLIIWILLENHNLAEEKRKSQLMTKLLTGEFIHDPNADPALKMMSRIFWENVRDPGSNNLLIRFHHYHLVQCVCSHSFLVFGPKQSRSITRHFSIATRASSSSLFRYILTWPAVLWDPRWVWQVSKIKSP